MKKLLLSLIKLLVSGLCLVHACYAVSTTESAAAVKVPVAKIMPGSELDKILNPKDPYPACTNRDDYWAQQSGPDSVKPESVAETTGMFISADRMIGQESGAHYAQGHVQAYKEDKSIVSDWLKYDQSTAHAKAGGNVVLSRQFDVINGQWMDYYIDLDRGVIKDATARSFSTGMYSHGKQINIINTKQVQVQSGAVTSCDPKHPSWEIRAKQINLDYQD